MTEQKFKERVKAYLLSKKRFRNTDADKVAELLLKWYNEHNRTDIDETSLCDIFSQCEKTSSITLIDDGIDKVKLEEQKGD